jgi:hypothetical protein
MSNNFDIYVAPNYITTCSPTCAQIKNPIVHIGSSASGKFQETTAPVGTISHNDDDSYAGELMRDASGNYLYSDQGGNVYTFGSVGAAGVPNSSRVSNIVFADGRRQDFLYDGNGQLKAVLDTSGYAMVFDWSGGVISAACGYDTAATYVSTATTCASAAIKASYQYTSGKLTGVTNAAGEQATYTYFNNEIECVGKPPANSCVIKNEYTAYYPWQVTRQSIYRNASAAPDVWAYAYSGDYTIPRDPNRMPTSEPTNTVVVTTPSSKTQSYRFVSSSLYGITDELSRPTSYKFEGGRAFDADPDAVSDFGSQLVEVVLPEGNRYTAAYEAPRNAKTAETWYAKTGGASLSNTYGYPPNCNAPYTAQNCAKPRWKKDAKGNQTDYDYTSWGGVIYEMEPAPTAGSARPLKLYTYVQKYAYIQNSGGSLVSSGVPIWLIGSMTQCQTLVGSSAAACDTTAPQLQTTYEYGADGTANNLLVRGQVVTDLATGVSRRTCYGYDAIGRKISQTSPRAGLAVCS